MDQAPTLCRSRGLQLEFHEARGRFFWLYRSADGWIVAESNRTYLDLKLCVADACQYMMQGLPD